MERAVLNYEESIQLKELIKTLTHSGSKTLARNLIDCVIQLCQKGKVYVDCAYNEIQSFMKKAHSEVRFSSVQIIDELTEKNEIFRKEIIENLDEFLKYSTALGSKELLPPPKKTSKDLMKLGLMCIDKWNKKYGREYRKLSSAVYYLEQGHNVDFTSFEIIDPKEKAQRKEKAKRMMKINKELLKKTNQEMEELKREMESTLTSLESCFNLLLPSPDEFAMDPFHDKNESWEDLRLYGMLNAHQGLMVRLDLGEKIKITETEENSAVIDNTRDCFTMIKNRFFPKTEAWIELIKKTEGDVNLLQAALAQKEVLQNAITKYKKIEIISFADQEDKESSDDSDLEEVALPKPDKKASTAEEISFLSETLGLNKRNAQAGPSINNEVHIEHARTENNCGLSDRKSQLLQVAPKLPYDIDLYHWEDEKLPIPTMLPVKCEGATTWSASLEIGELPIPGGSESLRSRVIEFTGKWEPVKRSCRTPLPSGKLCPRFDRVKCPLHGPIVNRDEQGNIVNKEDAENIEKQKTLQSQVPDWQDPKLLADILATTGVDLKMPEKGKRKKKKEFPGLTDLKAKKTTIKARISKKIFNKASMKRVAATLDKLEHKKHRDKFGDQFNYVHNT